jgi:hypothetical protein
MGTDGQPEVPASITLAHLHHVTQTVMGWEDYHLHLGKSLGIALLNHHQAPRISRLLQVRYTGLGRYRGHLLPDMSRHIGGNG